ncbi:hypothetical protein ZIOFF_039287 [Zingiber officinale]|uniref:Uncharacterized protein n=1 Tax=Zingiber officinale TaxID=94328 RepID=A0A8J5GB73_ZINOF|nr:hypothetical protein ZIOFF_039287 [Zingiber officinale]
MPSSSRYQQIHRAAGAHKSEGQQGRAGPAGSKGFRNSSSSSHFIVAVELERSAGPVVSKARTTLHLPRVLLLPSSSKDQHVRALSTRRRLLTAVPSSQRKSRDRQFDDNLQAPISDCINVRENKISGLKSHDCHILLEYLIPLATRGLLSESVIMDSQNSSLGTKRKLFIAPGSLARGRGKITRHLGLSGQNHVYGSIEHEPSLVNTCNNDMQCAFEQVDHVEDSQAQMESSQDKSSTQQNLNKRGKNKCGIVCKLKNGEKLLINFYMGRAVGLNHQAFTRHLGIIVRDGNICPIQVLVWNKIGEDAKNHMWAAVMKMSKTNTQNRPLKSMPPRTGSKPFRQLAYEMDEICEVVREDSSLSNIQLVEKCFGPQRHDHVFGHGGGVRPKDVRGPIASKQELHQENVTLREKMNNMESEFKAFKELMLKNLPPNVQVTASTSNTIEGAQAIGEEQ